MIDLLSKALNIVILVFLVSAMLGCGLSLTPRQIVAPLKNVRLAVSSAIASYILVPLIAAVASRIFALEEPLRFGLVLFSMAAGAEAGPKLVGIAKGNVGLSVGLLAAQLGITIFYVPLVVSFFLPEIHFDHMKILLKLCFTVALPIGVGLFMKAHYEKVAERLSPYVHKTCSLFMFLMGGLIIAVNHEGIYGLLGSTAILAAPVFIIGSFFCGYILGGPDPDTRRTLAVMSGTRNASISLMLASQVFSDPKVIMMIVFTLVVMLALVLPAVHWLGRRSETGLTTI